MSDRDIQHYLRAAEALYPEETYDLKAGRVVASGTTRAQIIDVSYGCWVPAWIWIDDATAVKHRLLAEEQQ